VFATVKTSDSVGGRFSGYFRIVAGLFFVIFCGGTGSRTLSGVGSCASSSVFVTYNQSFKKKIFFTGCLCSSHFLVICVSASIFVITQYNQGKTAHIAIPPISLPNNFYNALFIGLPIKSTL